jgi:hypothetical protein
VQAVRSQQDQYDEVRNEQRDVEPVGVVEALESAVEKMLADVRANALGGNDGGKRPQIRNEQISQARYSIRTDLYPLRKLIILPEARTEACRLG